MCVHVRLQEIANDCVGVMSKTCGKEAQYT